MAIIQTRRGLSQITGLPAKLTNGQKIANITARSPPGVIWKAYFYLKIAYTIVNSDFLLITILSASFTKKKTILLFLVLTMTLFYAMRIFFYNLSIIKLA